MGRPGGRRQARWVQPWGRSAGGGRGAAPRPNPAAQRPPLGAGPPPPPPRSPGREGPRRSPSAPLIASWPFSVRAGSRQTLARHMVTAEYQPFLTSSVAASAALIGLLFVSISIAPERVFGEKAESARIAQALSSFTALTNVFFISFASLIPKLPIGSSLT